MIPISRKPEGPGAETFPTFLKLEGPGAETFPTFGKPEGPGAETFPTCRKPGDDNHALISTLASAWRALALIRLQ